MRRLGPLLLVLVAVGVILVLTDKAPRNESDDASRPARTGDETGDPFLLGRDADAPTASEGPATSGGARADVPRGAARALPSDNEAETSFETGQALAKLDRLLVMAASSVVDVRAGALDGLGALARDADGVDDVVYAACLERALPVLFDAFGDDATWTVAFIALGGFQDSDLIDGLVALADNRRDPAVRTRALHAMADRAALVNGFDDAILDAVSEANPEVRAAGIRALAQSGEGPMYAEVARKALDDADPRIREAGVIWYEENGGGIDRGRGMELLDDPDPRVRARARLLLRGEYPEATWRSALADTAHADATWRLAALGDLPLWTGIWWEDPTEMLAVLERLLEDSDESIRATAVKQAGELWSRSRTLFPRIVELLRAGGTLAVEAARVLPQIERDAAKPHLEWAAEHGDETVKPLARKMIAKYYGE